MEVTRIDVPTTVVDPLAHCHRHWGNLPGCVFLDSTALPDPVDAAWSILAIDPIRTLGPGRIDPEALSRDLASRAHTERGIPFPGGWIGWFDYPGPGSGWPRCPEGPLTGWFGLYPAAFLWDRLQNRLLLAVAPWAPDRGGLREALLDRCVETLGRPAPPARPTHDALVKPQMVRETYRQKVRKVREWIAAGDVYQANLAQFLEVSTTAGPADLHARLRNSNPAPYAASLNTGNGTLLSTSPELFLEIRPDRSVRTRPIKGTRPRGKTADDDARICAELAADPKERAELLMIVDMERNDLGRVCTTGSVRVENMYRIRSYASVHHLTADVVGRLRTDTEFPEWIRATFPGGSISGAPKVRACEIIDELEGRPRGPYCGAIGFLSTSGEIRLNIAIRTGWLRNNRFHLGVGSGIVWDSDPDREYEETLHKAAAILHAFNLESDFQ